MKLKQQLNLFFSFTESLLRSFTPENEKQKNKNKNNFEERRFGEDHTVVCKIRMFAID